MPGRALGVIKRSKNFRRRNTEMATESTRGRAMDDMLGIGRKGTSRNEVGLVVVTHNFPKWSQLITT